MRRSSNRIRKFFIVLSPLFIAISYNACGKKFKPFETNSQESANTSSSANACPLEAPEKLFTQNKVLTIQKSTSSPFSPFKKVLIDVETLKTQDPAPATETSTPVNQKTVSTSPISIIVPKGQTLVALINTQCASEQTRPLLSKDIIDQDTTSERELSEIDAFLFHLTQSQDLDQLQQQALEDPCLIGISENRKYQPSAGELYNDPNNYLQTHLTALKAEGAYALLYPQGAPSALPGGDIIVAVVDTGVDYNHPDLKNNMWRHDQGMGFNIAKEGTSAQYDPMDISSISHGTHVAGLIAAQTNNHLGVSGVSPFATKIMAINAFYEDETSDTFLVVKAMLKAQKNGAHIVNLSLGKYGDTGATDHLYLEAAQQLTQQGVMVVTVTGNASQDFPQAEIKSSGGMAVLPALYGAEVPGMITVASVDVNSQSLSSFSHYSSKYAEIAAYGNTMGDGSFGIYSTLSYSQVQSYYGRLSGTSMAGPQVSGAAALIMVYLSQKNLKASPAVIEQLIANSATRHAELAPYVSEGKILDLENLAHLLEKCY